VKDWCENTVNVARFYLVTFPLLVAWTTWEEVFIRNFYWAQSPTILGPLQVPLRVMKYDSVRIPTALVLRDCRMLTDCCFWWIQSYQGRCQVSGSECWRCQSIVRSRHRVWFPWSHFTFTSWLYEYVCVCVCVCVCVRACVRARAPDTNQRKAKKQVKWLTILCSGLSSS